MANPIPPGIAIATTADDHRPAPTGYVQADQYVSILPAGLAMGSQFLSVTPPGLAQGDVYLSVLPTGLAIAVDFVAIEATFFADEFGNRFISEGGDYFIG